MIVKLLIFVKENQLNIMPARDKYHEHIKEALIKDDWDVTHDPYIIETEGVSYPVDLGAEKIIAAEKGSTKIAIEIKSFLKESAVSEYHTALGQFLNYRIGLIEIDKDRQLYLAIPKTAYIRLKRLPIIMKSIEVYELKLVIFDVYQKKILEWKE